VERILGSYEEAAISLRFLQEGRQPQAVLLNDLGLVLRGMGEADSARVYFERAWEVDRTAGEAGYNLALEALAAGDTAAALDWLARVEERTPYWYPTPLLAGRIHRAQGRSAMAQRALEAAYRLNPQSPVTAAELDRKTAGPRRGGEADSLLIVAESFMLAGDMALAGHYSIRAAGFLDLRGTALMQSTWSKVPTGTSHSVRVVQLEASMEYTPDADDRVLAMMEREMGNAHAHIGNLDDAREHLERALELLSGDMDLAAPTAAQLISLYLRIDDVESATKLTERLQDTDDPTLLGAMAAAAAASGDDAAAEEFRKQQQTAAYLSSGNTPANQNSN
jgi:tetratricopeptide (TPR) repeat protein